MVISRRFQCIYIKLGKVASTSFEIALRKRSAGDIINPRHISKPRVRCSDHLSARKLKERIPEDIWDNYLKVATIRCPYDMLISHYYFWRSRSSKTMNFKRFVARRTWTFELIYGLHEREAEQSTGIKRLLTDFLIRYEHLDEDIKELEIRINCPGLLNTFQSITIKKGIRPKVGTAAYEMYSKYPATKTIVDEKCKEAAKEYEFFGRYWLAYKARLEAAIKEHGACSG